MPLLFKRFRVKILLVDNVLDKEVFTLHLRLHLVDFALNGFDGAERKGLVDVLGLG